MLYNIRLANLKDGPSIMSFLNKYWKHGHVLSKDIVLFDFQYLSNERDGYNFVIEENNSTGEIDGIFGFIPTWKYDLALIENGDVWGAIWKVRTDISNQEINGSGLYLFDFLLHEVPFVKTYGGVGLSSIAKKIYKLYGFNLGKLSHYYIANESVAHFCIAKNIKSFDSSNKIVVCEVKEIDIEDISNSPFCSYEPKKSIAYLVNRYKKHPYYKYFFWGILNEGNLISIWVLRRISVGEHSVIRVVDVLGNIDKIGSLYVAIQEQLKKWNSEYLDFLNYGISEFCFTEMGFSKLNFEDNEIIIPNYFEPFEARNIQLDVTYNHSNNYIAFKGDSDQDRPNVL
jgi:hypothetical protein